MKSSSIAARSPLGGILREIYRARWAYFFVAPACLLFAVFILYPLAQGLYLSLFRAGLSPERTFVGLDNFRRLAQDAAFTRALLNTFTFVLGVVPLALVLSLGVAVLIFPLSNRVQSFYRMAFYLPGVAS